MDVRWSPEGGTGLTSNDDDRYIRDRDIRHFIGKRRIFALKQPVCTPRNFSLKVIGFISIKCNLLPGENLYKRG